MQSTLAELMSTVAQTGHVRWIGLRPQRGAPMQTVGAAWAEQGGGLGPAADPSKQGAGLHDYYAGRDGKRGITLIQHEHLPVVAALCGRDTIDPAVLRRNVVIGGINLLALRGRRFRIGSVLLEATGACHPCSKMEVALGQGGYNALRGHGGLTAGVLASGLLSVGDAVYFE